MRDGVLEWHLADLRQEAAAITGTRSLKDLTRADWESYSSRLTKSHDALLAKLPGRYDLEAGLERVFAQADGRVRDITGIESRATDRRVADEFRTALGEAYRDRIGLPDRPNQDGLSRRGWWEPAELAAREADFRTASFEPYARTLEHRLAFEADLHVSLEGAAERFHTLSSSADPHSGRAVRTYRTTEGTLDRLGMEFRADWTTEFHWIHGPAGRDVAAWLTREHLDGNVFASGRRAHWDALRAESDAARKAVELAEHRAAMDQWRTGLRRGFSEFLLREDVLRDFDRRVTADLKSLTSPETRTAYQAFGQDLRAQLQRSWDETSGAGGVHARRAAVDDVRDRLDAMNDAALRQESEYRTWRNHPEWTVDLQQQQVVRVPFRPSEALPSWATPEGPGGGPGHTVGTEPVTGAVRGSAPGRTAGSAPTTGTRDAALLTDSGAARALEQLRAGVEAREAAHVRFDERLDGFPASAGHSPAVLADRDWFAREWSRASAAERERLDVELDRRLALHEAAAVAHTVFDETFPVGSHQAGRHAAALAALRDEFGRAVADRVLVTDENTGAHTTPTHGVVLEYARDMVDGFRDHHAQVVADGRLREYAHRAFERALATAPERRFDVSLEQGDLSWGASGERHWYERQLQTLRQEYTQDWIASAQAPDPQVVRGRLDSGARQAARGLITRAPMAAALLHSAETAVRARIPAAWPQPVASWFRDAAQEIVQTSAQQLTEVPDAARGPVAADLLTRLDALQDVGHARALAHQSFEQAVAGQPVSAATVTHQATAGWVGRRLDEVREEYVRAHLAAHPHVRGQQTEADTTESAPAPDSVSPLVPAPSSADAGDWRAHAWESAQLALHREYDGVLARHAADRSAPSADRSVARTADPAGRTTPQSVGEADRRAFDDVFDAWSDAVARRKSAPPVEQVRERVLAPYVRDVLAGRDRASALAALRDGLRLETARHHALRRGTVAFDRAFGVWAEGPHESGTTTPSYHATEELLAQVEDRAGQEFQDRLSRSVRHVLGDGADLDDGLKPVFDRAMPALRALTDALPERFGLLASYTEETQRVGELLVRRAGTVGDEITARAAARTDTAAAAGTVPSSLLSAESRALLDHFGVHVAAPSPQGRDAVLEQIRGRLDRAFTDTFDRESGLPEAPSVRLARWDTEVRRQISELAGHLAVQAAREAAARRTADDAERAEESWLTDPPEQATEFLRRFGTEPGEQPQTLPRHGTPHRAEADTADALFAQVFGLPGTTALNLTEKLVRWERRYAATLGGTERLNARKAARAARHTVESGADHLFGEELAAWQAEHPGRPLTEAGVARARAGLRERALSAYDALFPDSATSLDDLTGNLARWDRRLASLARDLPAHLAFEAEASTALHGAAASFATLADAHGLLLGDTTGPEHDRLQDTAERFRQDWYEAYRVLWAPQDLSRTWADQEAYGTDAFGAALADAERSAAGSGSRSVTPYDRAPARLSSSEPNTTTNLVEHGVADLPDRTPAGIPLPTLAALEALQDDALDELAKDAGLSGRLRRALAPDEYARVVAALVVRVPAGVTRPGAAREAARRQVARLLQNPEVATRLLNAGSRVIVVPKNAPLTSLEPFLELAGQLRPDGKAWDETRGAAGWVAAVGEENLLGETSSVVPDEALQADGYSLTVHEVAHLVYEIGLDEQDRELIRQAYRDTLRSAQRAEEAAARGFRPRKSKKGLAFPDGDWHRLDSQWKPVGDSNYSSRDPWEFFAQIAETFLDFNKGRDPHTGLRRNNGGAEWVRRHQPSLLPLLRRLFGTGGSAGERANPVAAALAESESIGEVRGTTEETGTAQTPVATGAKALDPDEFEFMLDAVLTHALGARARSNHAGFHAAPSAWRGNADDVHESEVWEGYRALWDRTADAGTAHATPQGPRTRAATAPGTEETTAAPDARGVELTSYARDYGALHDGHVGHVQFEKTPKRSCGACTGRFSARSWSRRRVRTPRS